MYYLQCTVTEAYRQCTEPTGGLCFLAEAEISWESSEENGENLITL